MAQTPAWRVGWPAWKTVTEALSPPSPPEIPPITCALPPPFPAAEQKPPPPYTRTLVLAALLFLMDGYIGGGGFFSIVILCLGLPVLVLRALLAWKNPPLLKRRLASVGIYGVAALATLVLVRTDQAGARARGAGDRGL